MIFGSRLLWFPVLIARNFVTDEIHLWRSKISSQMDFICVFFSEIHKWSVDVDKKIVIRTKKHIDKIHRWSVDLISTYNKEGETTQTRSTDDLWTSVYDKDGERACDTDEIHRSSVDLVCAHNNEGHYCGVITVVVKLVLELPTLWRHWRQSW